MRHRILGLVLTILVFSAPAAFGWSVTNPANRAPRIQGTKKVKAVNVTLLKKKKVSHGGLVLEFTESVDEQTVEEDGSHGSSQVYYVSVSKGSTSKTLDLVNSGAGPNANPVSFEGYALRFVSAKFGKSPNHPESIVVSIESRR